MVQQDPNGVTETQDGSAIFFLRKRKADTECEKTVQGQDHKIGEKEEKVRPFVVGAVGCCASVPAPLEKIRNGPFVVGVVGSHASAAARLEKIRNGPFVVGDVGCCASAAARLEKIRNGRTQCRGRTKQNGEKRDW